MKIKTESFYNKILLIDLMIYLYIEIFKCYFEFAQILNFLPDILNLCAVVLLIKNRKLIIKKNTSSISCACFLFAVTISIFYGEVNVANAYQRYRYILYGIITFHLCIHYMEEKTWYSIINLLYISQIIHSLFVCYQFFVLKVGSDFANGIFGFANYNNSMQGLYCLVMSIMGLEFFIKKIMPPKQSITMIVLSCITCAISEIKAFFVIFIVVFILIILLNSKSKNELKKYAIIIIIGIIGIYLAYRILLVIKPGNLVAFGGLNNWLAYEQFETARAGGYGRATQLVYCYSKIFNSDFLSAFFGKGLSYRNDLVVYQLSKIFTNFGFFGLGTFLIFLISLAFETFKNKRINSEAMISFLMCLVVLISLIVWGEILNRSVFIVFIMLAIGNANFVAKSKCG